MLILSKEFICKIIITFDLKEDQVRQWVHLELVAGGHGEEPLQMIPSFVGLH